MFLTYQLRQVYFTEDYVLMHVYTILTGTGSHLKRVKCYYLQRINYDGITFTDDYVLMFLAY